VTSSALQLLDLFGSVPETVLVEMALPGCVRIVLNRPGIRNAFNEAMIAELTTLLELATDKLAPHDFRALLLCGAGEVFCAGADLEMMRRQGKASAADNRRDAQLLARLFAALARVPVPVICSVQGAAIGGGFGLAVCSDVVVSHADAIFATSEVRLGLVPAVISPYIVRRLGVGAAALPLLSGIRVSSKRAMELGLVQYCAEEKSALDGAVMETVHDFLSGAPLAQRETKRLLQLAHPLPSQELIAQTEASIAAVRSSPEAAEGLECFFSKTPPSWTQPKRFESGDAQ
jgi:methylglutaconyl-CoA hydratase